MNTLLRWTILGLALAPLPALAAGNKAVNDWNTDAFATTPNANTNAFSKTPPANTSAFAKRPPANGDAFGTRNGGKVTAFGRTGQQAPMPSAIDKTAHHNANRMANSLGTGNDHNASPVASAAPGH